MCWSCREAEAKQDAQSANPVSKQEAVELLKRFTNYFENDGRHHIWVASVSSGDLLVYDRHNVIYAYGPLPEYENVLAGCGLRKVESVRLPSPHAHHYHAVFDQDERNLLGCWDWKRSPLRDSDE